MAKAKSVPTKPTQSARSSDMVEVAVTLERPASEDLTQYNRAEKYDILRGNTAELRDGLIAWIAEQGWSEEVAQVGEATVFNMLFVVCTPRAAEEMTRAPGVVSVGVSEEFEIDLPRPTDQSQHL